MTRVLWLFLSVGLLVLAGSSARAEASPLLRVDGPRATVVDDPSIAAAGALSEPGVGRTPAAASRGPRGGARAARRRGPTVSEVLARADRRGSIRASEQSGYRAIYSRAVRTRRSLTPGRAGELGGVIANLRGIAARGRLTPSRMPVLFLMLHRNTDYWRWHGAPADRSSIEFAGSPLVFQYLRGEGLHFNSLATAGRANYFVRACSSNPPAKRNGTRCTLGRTLLDELTRLAAQRSGFTAWEYYVDFDGGLPPWSSGIAQGAAIQAFTRGSQVYSEPAYLATAGEAVGAFARRPPDGHRLALADGGVHYLIYSFAPRLRVLNAFAQALNGIHDYARVSGSREASALFDAGHRGLQHEIRRYDTGSWSRYSLRGYESSVDYHRLARDTVEGLCQRTGTDVYCNTARRFTSYLRRRGYSTEPGSLGL